MSDADADPEVTELLADLTRSLQELETELEPDRRLRPPTLRELSQFTSEVAIPGLILLLRTNIKALQLLQRTIRLAEGREPRARSTGQGVRDRAEKLSRATLAQVDETLSEIQSAVEGRPPDDETRELLSEARNLRDEIQDELGDGEADSTGTGADGESQEGDDEPGREMVDIDVEAELQSLKDNLEDDGQSEDTVGDDEDGTDVHGSGTDGDDGADDAGDGDDGADDAGDAAGSNDAG